MSDREELLTLIEAELDGELDVADRARLEAALRDDPSLAAEAAELRRLRDVFRAVPAESAPEGFSDEVLRRTIGADAAATEARAGFRLLRAAPWIAGLAAASLLVLLMAPWESGDVLRDVETADAPSAESLDRDAEATAGERRQGGAQGRADDRYGGAAAPAEKPVAETATRELEDAVGDDVARRTRQASDPAQEPPAESKGMEPVPVPGGPPAPAAPTAGAKEGRGAPGPSAPRPSAEPETAAEQSTAQDALDAGDASPAPRTRRYVVFEDEAAARRYLASVQRAARSAGADGKSRRAAEQDDAPPGARSGSGEASRDAPTGGGGVGGGGGARSTGFFAESGPRVLHRVALAAADPDLGELLARAPEGAAFGEDVADEVLSRAEARFERQRKALESGLGASADSPDAEESPGDAREPAEPPARSETRARAKKRDGAEVEIVIVLVPEGTLRAAGSER